MQAEPLAEPLAVALPEATVGGGQCREFLDRKFKPLLKASPAAALSEGRTFLSTAPNLSTDAKVRLAIEMALQLHAVKDSQENRHQNSADALQLLDDATVAASSEIPRVTKDLKHFVALAKLGILMDAGKFREADLLWDEYKKSAQWDDRMFLAATDISRRIYRLQGLPADGVDDLKQMVETRVLMRRRVELPLLRALVEELVALKRTDEALAYAKLAYVLVPCQQTELEAAAKLLQAAWQSRNESEKYVAFMAAQEGGRGANPLNEVALPELSRLLLNAELPRARAFSAKATKSALRCDELISLLLIDGQFRSALDEALKFRQANQDNPEGILTICRVFKAVDGSVARATQFAALAGQGQGSEMLAVLEARLGAATAPEAGKLSDAEVAAMHRAIEESVVTRRQVDTASLKRMVTSLLENGRKQEALSYAKLAFVLCAYNDSELQIATQLLTQSWTAQGQTPALTNFIKAQATIGSDNPLQGIALPTFSSAGVEAALERCRQGIQLNPDNRRRQEELVTLLLLSSQTKPAMETAQRVWNLDKKSQAGIAAVARVFKAADGSLARANKFVAAANAGTGGEELVREFLNGPTAPEVKA